MADKTRTGTKNNRKTKMAAAPFQIKDCALIVRISDMLPAINLREFRQQLTQCPIDSVYHHFFECALRPSFDDPEFHNDFARWAKRDLHDSVLAERLEIINPYEFPDLEELRKNVVDIVDDRLSEIHTIPWALDDSAFIFHSATTVVFDTTNTINSPQELSRAVREMTAGSVYYHFWEARRRTEERIDDFTVWLKDWNHHGAETIKALSEIDFYFMGLSELRGRLIEVFDQTINSRGNS